MIQRYEQRVQVLKNMGYIDQESAVQLKGRVACEVTTCDELIATELVFANALTDMAPEEIVVRNTIIHCIINSPETTLVGSATS